MDKKLYDLMDWPEIEAVVYSECKHPLDILGQHITPDGLLFQTFKPGAVGVKVVLTGKNKTYDMEQVDEAGYFALLIPGKRRVAYELIVDYGDGNIQQIKDTYSFKVQILESELERFEAGINYELYNVLGAHPMEVDGVQGVHFAVWAPNAWRVSVVGDFNSWDGRAHQMQFIDKYGVYELFIPGVKPLDIYKYELKYKGGMVGLKADPYAFYSELRPNNASIVYDIEKYVWTDGDWLEQRELNKNKPMSIYELHLGSFMKPEDGREFYNYRELAPLIIKYVKEMGYTHIELMPIMEHPFDGSWGYQVTGYYAPTSRYGTPDDFRYFVDLLHCAGIGVILDWVPAHFPKDDFGLARFDGTALYEHLDPRQGEHPEWGTYIYNYGRPQVRNFLIANALFWAKEYHVDGLRMDAVASMLYLDYGKKNGEWVANIYGGNENLEAVEFFKQLNAVYRKKNKTSMLIAEESTAWPMVTGDIKDGSLGFDYKWNMGWMNDFLDFMSADPLFRKGRYGELTFSMIYAYSEDFILVISHDEVVHGKCSMINKMPEDELDEKFSDLRAAYGFMYTHPGKKLLFMGQDFGQYNEWWEKKSVDWDELSKEQNQKLHRYMKDLNALYKNEQALYELDYNPEGFEWINNISADECIVSYVRRAKNGDELLVVVSFTPVLREKYKIGVPKAGHYKEIFNSNAKKYGGTGKLNSRVKISQESECDNRKDSIYITIPPLGICIFRRVEEESVTADEVEIPEIVDTQITKSETVSDMEKEKSQKKAKPESVKEKTLKKEEAPEAAEKGNKESKESKENKENKEKASAGAGKKKAVRSDEIPKVDGKTNLKETEAGKAEPEEVKNEVKTEKMMSGSSKAEKTDTAKTDTEKKNTAKAKSAGR